MGNKIRVSYSLSDETISTIAAIAAKNGQTVSYVVEKLIATGLSQSSDLNRIEETTWIMKRIMYSIESMFNICGVKGYSGNFIDCILLLSKLDDRRFFISDKMHIDFRISYIELLDSILRIDHKLFEEISTKLKCLPIANDEKNQLVEAFQKKKKSSEVSELHMPRRTIL